MLEVNLFADRLRRCVTYTIEGIASCHWVDARSQSRRIGKYGHLLTASFLLIYALSGRRLTAQDPNTFQQGILPYQSYDDDGVGSVNVASGTLNLQIPIISYKQRGTLPNYTLNVAGTNGGDWSTVWECNNPACSNARSQWQGGGGAGVQLRDSLATSLNTNYVCLGGGYNIDSNCYDSDTGNTYWYNYSTVQDSTGTTHIVEPVNGKTGSLAIDGSGYSVNMVGTSLEVFDARGNAYYSGCDSNQYGICTQSYSWVKDTHGNGITYNFPAGDGTSATSVTDSIGRQIPIFAPFYETSSQCFTQDFPVWADISTVSNATTAPVQICYLYGSASTSFGVPGILEATKPFAGIQSVTTPEGTWQFGYDSWGEVNSITTPTGATVTYVWQTVTPGDMPYSSAPMEARAIFSRTINVGGIESTWQYKFANDTTDTVTTVTDPFGNDSVHTFGFGTYETNVKYYNGPASNNFIVKTVDTTYSEPPSYYVPMGWGSWGDYVKWPAYNGVTVKSVTTTLPVNNSGNDITMVCTIYDSNQNTGCGSTDNFNSPTLSFSDPNSGNLEFYNSGSFPMVVGSEMYKYEYDFGSSSSGAMLRETSNTYLWQTNANYLNANLLGLIRQSSVYSGCNSAPCGSQNQVASSTIGYDEINSPQGVYGNATSVTVWSNGGSSPKTQTIYNANGMPTAKCDPIDINCANPTRFAYDSTGLYLQGVQYPITGTATQHSETYGYDSNTGLLDSHADQNSVLSQYVYYGNTSNNNFQRLETATNAVGLAGLVDSTSYSYPSITETDTKQDQSTTNDGLIQETTLYDSLMRPTSTKSTSDPEGVVSSDTTYDLLGRTWTTTNPYRTTSDSTYDVITSGYDALGRKVIEFHKDGTKKQWCYDGVAATAVYPSLPTGTSYSPTCNSKSVQGAGEWVDMTDENGNVDQETFDGLGRMTHIFEPNGRSTSPSMETDYTYDPEGNLLKVIQWGGSANSSGARVRTFSYNSLSQLVCASNPEASLAQCPAVTPNSYVPGTIGYTYDLNGNVVSKTDARGVTIHYSYDALNRLYQKVYSLNGSATNDPTVCMQYDLPNVGYSDGRLTMEWTQTAGTTCPGPANPISSIPSGALTGRVISSYDPMGRSLGEQQYTPVSIANGTPYSMGYTYDLAGDLTTSTTGAAPPNTSFAQPSTSCNLGMSSLAATMLTYFYCYDAAQHLTSMMSNTSNIPNVLFNASAYNSAGGLGDWTYGPASSGTYAVTLHRNYDPRMRVTAESDKGKNPNNTTGNGIITIVGP